MSRKFAKISNITNSRNANSTSDAISPLNQGNQILEDFQSLIENDNSIVNIKEGTVVHGIVTQIENDIVTVDVGYKAESQIPIREFKLSPNDPLPEIGKMVEVFIEKLEGRGGKMVLSRQKAIREESWKQLEKLYEEGSFVDGVIFSRVKGGLVVDLSGVVAFLPGGQVDTKPVKDPESLMGILQKFKILKMDTAQGNVVVSRRAVIEDSRSGDREKMLSSITEGMVLKGSVKNITDYGAFIDLGSVDGLLHITDIDWKRINHPSEKLSIDQELDVMVVKFDPETKRIHLGLKQLKPSPWDAIETRYKVNDIIKGKVVNITDYAGFIELEEGIEGMLHSSEISWSKSECNPRRKFSIGQEIDCMIINLDKEANKIFLSLKKMNENPWQKFADSHKVGDVINTTVSNTVSYAIFASVGDKIDGMIHETDISWDGKGSEKIQEYNKGDKIQCKILAIDPQKEKIGLGIKQLTEDPYKDLYSKYKEGSVISAKVVEGKNDYNVYLVTQDGIPAVIKKQDISSDKREQRVDKFEVGETVEATVINIDRSNSTIYLSIKDYEDSEKKRIDEEYGSHGSNVNSIANITNNN